MLAREGIRISNPTLNSNIYIRVARLMEFIEDVFKDFV